MLPPLPRRSVWAYCFAHFTQPYQPSPKGSSGRPAHRPFEACSAFTRVAACTLAPSPIRDAHSEGFSHFVTSIAAPVASGWSVCQVGVDPLERAALSRRTPNAANSGSWSQRHNVIAEILNSRQTMGSGTSSSGSSSPLSPLAATGLVRCARQFDDRCGSCGGQPRVRCTGFPEVWVDCDEGSDG